MLSHSCRLPIWRRMKNIWWLSDSVLLWWFIPLLWVFFDLKILKDECYVRCLKKAYTYILTVWWLSGLVLSQPSYESCWSWTLRDEWYIVMKAYIAITLQLRDFGIYYYIVCPCYLYDVNCTCNATD